MNYNWNWAVLLQPVATGESANYLDWIIHGFFVTFGLTVCAWMLALAVGTFFGILRTWPNRAGRMLGTAYVSIFRNIPLIVQFFIWYFVVPEILPTAAGNWIKGIQPSVQFFVVSVCALGVYTGSRICEQLRAGILALPRGQKNAALAMGFSLSQSYRHIILPQVFRHVMPPLTSEFLIISKNSAVASTIGLLELSRQAQQLVDFTAQPYESFILVTLAYVFMNFLILRFMNWVRRRHSVPGLMEN